MTTSFPARANCSPHIAPEGPPPTIAILDMGRPLLPFLLPVEVRREPSRERENRQGETGAQYSTENRCSRRALCLTSYYVDCQPRQYSENHEIRRQQEHQYFRRVKPQQRPANHAPRNCPQNHRKNQSPYARHRCISAEKNF